MRLLVLSPHYDDAPLSLGQSMVDGELSRHRVTVGIVCARSNWVQWFHPTRRRWPLATAIRMAEEAVNAVRFRYRIRLAGVEETPLRTGKITNESFLVPSYEPASPDAADALAPIESGVRGWAAKYDVVISPLGLGDHVDHQLTREAARRLLDEGAAVAFYEDRPYACLLTDDEVSVAVKAVDSRLERRPVSRPMGRGKHGRIWYPSQFDEYFLGAIASDEEQGRREHVWVLPDSPWPAA